FNAMYVNFASGGAAFYPSQVLPRAPGSKGDPLARGIQLAHQRGLAVHAKLIALFLFKGPKDFQQELLAANRVMRGPDSQPIEQAGSYWLCPSQDANRALLAAATAEMVRRYPVDGLHLDYIRFSEQPSCYCSSCRQAFERDLGQPVAGWPATAVDGPYRSRFRQWKIRLINSRVHELATLARQYRPGLTVSAAVFHSLSRAREEKAQDWQAWLERRDVDYVCTMSYTPRLADFEEMIASQHRVADHRQIVVGIGSWKLERMADLVAQIKTVRRAGAPGFVLFSYDDADARDFLPRFAVKR
ncbi:family 10 glycosylhydrolase, partial [bacterium]|nr:family 10 glycosylhydrolase [bacterium]